METLERAGAGRRRDRLLNRSDAARVSTAEGNFK
jgi:hypothetical protein